MEMKIHLILISLLVDSNNIMYIAKPMYNNMIWMK